MDLPVHGEEVPIIPIASTYAGAHGHAQAPLHDPRLHSPNGHFPLTATSTSVEDGDAHCASCDSKKGAAAVVYRECLKNHAASIGGSALDGCGEFMPGGSEGTLEALKCSACGCHRNFHRKEVEGDLHGGFRRQLVLGRKTTAGQKGVLISAAAYAYGCYPSTGNSSVVHMPSPHRMVMPLGALQSSEWPEEMEGRGDGTSPPRSAAAKKRFRTKFTQEQKEKMRAFAEKTGWRLLREDEDAVQHFCQEIGVKRRVLKVWMHNNKNIAKKISPPRLE